MLALCLQQALNLENLGVNLKLMFSKIVVSGSIAIDRIMHFPGKYREIVEPDKLEVFSISVLLDEIKESRGGTGANIAYNMALIGDSPVLLGSVGRDARGYIDDLKSSGVVMDRVYFSHLPTASFNVINDSEDNQVGGFYPGAMADSSSLSLDEYNGQDVLIVVSAHDPAAMKKQVRQCKGNNLRLVYDVSQQLATIGKEDLLEGIAVSEVMIVNEYEMTLLSSKSGFSEGELAKKVPILISTHGRNGSIIGGNKVGKKIKVGIAKPDAVKDPTGAGDGYRAGFLYGHARGWELEKCGQLGATTASFVVERYGSQVKYSKPQITNRYKENFGKEIEL